MGLGLALGGQLLSLSAQAEPRVDKDEREYSAEAAPRPADMPLSALPEPPKLELPPPRPEAVRAIDDVLVRLVSDDPIRRERALRELLEAKADWTGGLARKLDQAVEGADRKALGRLMEETVKRARKSEDESSRDPLSTLLAEPRPLGGDEKSLAGLLGIARMLGAVNSTEAARELIRLYARTGDFLRVEVQKQLDGMGDRSLAALIEARRHQAEAIARWASRQLDLRGKAIAHEAVRTSDPAALADILVALGRSQDLDASRVLLSFASSERAQVRTAARQGLVLLGEAAAWPLRDAYLDTTGKKPPREWTWKRTARELFTEFDRLRLDEVFALFERAEAARKKGDLAAMKKGYDEVLTESPLFEARADMALGYLEFAKTLEVTSEERAEALGRAERLATSEAQKNEARALRLLTESARLERRGIVDRTLGERAAELSGDVPSVSALAAAETPHLASPWVRYGVALTVSVLALGGAFWILGSARFRRSRELSGPDPEASEAQVASSKPQKPS